MPKPVSLSFANMAALYESKGSPDLSKAHPLYELVSVDRVQETSQGYTEEMVIRRKEDGELFARKITHTKTSYFDTGANDMTRYFAVFSPYHLI